MKTSLLTRSLALALGLSLSLIAPLSAVEKTFQAKDLLTPVDAVPITPIPVESPEQMSEPVTAASETPIEDDKPREMIRERFPNGSVRIEREMIQDSEGNFVRHGIYREFDAKGALIAEGQYNRGKREGMWRRVHQASESPLFATAPYKDFRPPFLSQVNFDGDAMNGKWTIVDSQQRKASEIDFQSGDRHGQANWYHPSGVLMMQITYNRGRVHGEVVKWGSDSTVIAKETYLNGRKIAPKVEHFPNQAKKQELTYLHAMLYMRTPDNWDKAQLATFENRGQDEKHGPFMMWHPNGTLARQGEFRYNLPVGKIVYWYENGQKQMEGNYVDGRQDGEWTWYHANGQKSIAGQYRDGKTVGKWTWWHPEGKVAQKADYSAERPLAPIVRGLTPADREAQLPQPTSDTSETLR
jgi:uncharacterized protein